MLKNKIPKENARAALYAFAIGDAMGATTEFMDAEDIKNKYGAIKSIVGGGWLNLKKGSVTDDTEMTMCIMTALMRTGVNVSASKFKHEAARRLCNWFDGGPKDVGNTCAAGLLAYERSNHSEFAKRNDDLLGNGALIRSLPCALLGLDKYNKAQGDITHPSQGSARAIQEYARAIRISYNGNYSDIAPTRLLAPSGDTIATLNNAMFYGNFDTIDSIRMAVNNGGDADSIAALSGAISAVRLGVKSIPSEWLDTLDESVICYIDMWLENYYEEF